jgi:hypothetical protein
MVSYCFGEVSNSILARRPSILTDSVRGISQSLEDNWGVILYFRIDYDRFHPNYFMFTERDHFIHIISR